MDDLSGGFRETVYFDTEFYAPEGERAKPVCLVTYEERSQRVTRYWLWNQRPPVPPYRLFEPNVVWVAYTANADLPVLHTLGWPSPPHVIDLAVEMRNVTNGALPSTFIGLSDTAKKLGISYLSKAEKDAYRDICIRGDSEEIQVNRQPLLRYCQEDVVVLADVLRRLAAFWSWPHALHRGRFVRAYTDAEYDNLSINQEAYDLIRSHRGLLRQDIAQGLNDILRFPLYERDHLRMKRLVEWVQSQGWEGLWPRTSTGKLSTEKSILREIGLVYEPVEHFRQTKESLDQLDNVTLAIGRDGRNRYLGGLFGTITGRAAPKARASILLQARWWRNLIRPQPGYSLCYLDFSAQEFLVLALLSGDLQGLADYQSGDVYITWGRSLGLMPQNGSLTEIKRLYGKTRNLLKAAVLGMNYGMGMRTLAQYLQVSTTLAQQIHQSFRARYRKMYEYGRLTVVRGENLGCLRTRLDWRLQGYTVIDSKRILAEGQKASNQLTRESLRNWPVQAHAAEILRASVIFAVERGAKVVQTLHDAIWIEAKTEEIDYWAERVVEAMQDAGEAILPCPLSEPVRFRVDSKKVHFPEHWVENGSETLWQIIRDSLLKNTGKDIETMDLEKVCQEV
jgi:DNA polymerase family A